MEGTASATALAGGLRPLGQRVFSPPSVKGWEGGRTWINANTILGRANLVRQLIDAKTTRFNGGSLAEYLDSQGLKSPGELVDWLEELLLAVPLPSHARSELIALRRRSGADPAQRAADVIHALAATPEFHLA